MPASYLVRKPYCTAALLSAALLCSCSRVASTPVHSPAPSTPTAAEPKCKQLGPALPTLAEKSSEEIIREHGTGLDAYKLEGGVWLKNAPVLVNRDFDFALAMALEGGLGAGLAAAKRREENEAFAKKLSVELDEKTRKRLDELRRCGVHAWFLLWGAEEVELVLVVDGDEKKPPQLVQDQKQGSADWGATNVLEREVASLLNRLPD